MDYIPGRMILLKDYRTLLPEALKKGLIIVITSIPIILLVLYMRGNTPSPSLAGQIAAFIFGAFFALGIFTTLTAILGVRDSFLIKYFLTERGQLPKEYSREERMGRALYFFCLGIPALFISIVLHLF